MIIPLILGLAAAGGSALLVKKFIFPHWGEVSRPQPRQDRFTADPFVAGSFNDKRRCWRRGGNPVEVQFAPPGKKEEAKRGWIFDRSVGGIGILAWETLPEGTPLIVLPVNAPEMTPWVEVQVRHCREASDGIEIGCQFNRTPPWPVLLLFG